MPNMIGFELILSGTSEPIQCVYFEDADAASVYAHEPLCDMWASVEDMLAEHPGTTLLIGPITPLALMHQWVRNDYIKSIEELNKQSELLNSHYASALKQIEDYEKLISPEARTAIERRLSDTSS